MGDTTRREHDERLEPLDDTVARLQSAVAALRLDLIKRNGSSSVSPTITAILIERRLDGKDTDSLTREDWVEIAALALSASEDAPE